MTELIAYRYKQHAADGIHETQWTQWRSGRLRAEMMTELRQLGTSIAIVQCCVQRAEVDPINGRENDLWIWTRSTGWQKSNARNWFVDSCDPTARNDSGDDEDPFGKARGLTAEERDEIHRQVYGAHDDLTDAITAEEMATE